MRDGIIDKPTGEVTLQGALEHRRCAQGPLINTASPLSAANEKRILGAKVGAVSVIGIGEGLTALATGSPEAVARLRLPQNVACGFPALRSSSN